MIEACTKVNNKFRSFVITFSVILLLGLGLIVDVAQGDILSVPNDFLFIQDAINEFNTTANQIIDCKRNQSWPNPAVCPPEETCNICDLRWGCTVPNPGYSRRYPI